MRDYFMEEGKLNSGGNIHYECYRTHVTVFVLRTEIKNNFCKI